MAAHIILVRTNTCFEDKGEGDLAFQVVKQLIVVGHGGVRRANRYVGLRAPMVEAKEASHGSHIFVEGGHVIAVN